MLQPNGKVLIHDGVYDAVTRGDYTERDTPVEIIAQEGSTLTVKRVTE